VSQETGNQIATVLLHQHEAKKGFISLKRKNENIVEDKKAIKNKTPPQ
jgi:hypothetical protein